MRRSILVVASVVLLSAPLTALIGNAPGTPWTPEDFPENPCAATRLMR